VTRFTYDPNGNSLTLKDVNGNTTSYVYDALDRVQQRTDPLGKSESYQYDGNGNLIQHTDRKSQGTTFSYDGLNRPTVMTGVGHTVTRTWDGGNRLTQIVDSVGGTITKARDGLDRLTTETTALGIVRYDNPSNPADRGYDTLGRRLWMEAPGQARVTYSWDAASRLTQIQQGSQLALFTYDNANRRTLVTLPNGATTEYQYDLASQLTALIYRNPSATELGRLAYGYDAAGNRSIIGESFANTLLPDSVTETSYNAGNRQTGFGAKILTYDDNGNLTQITEGAESTDLTWDSRNRLTAFSTSSSAATFGYDALGRRASKTMGGTFTQFQYDRLDVVREVVGSTAVGYLNGPGIDEPLVRGGNEFFWADALGSALRLTDATGVVATSYRYEPFGRAVVAAGSSTNPVQYAGRETDGPGLQYYRARYYHPGLQRFISEDPIGFGGGDTNLYVYVGNSPTNATDPFGLKVLNPNNYPIQPRVLQALEDFNGHIGLCKDIIITGGDSPRAGYHGLRLAADIRVPGQPHLQTANQAVDSGLFNGIGWYEEGYTDPTDPKVGPHVHVDLRPPRDRFLWGFDRTGRRYRGSFPKYQGPRNDCPPTLLPISYSPDHPISGGDLSIPDIVGRK